MEEGTNDGITKCFGLLESCIHVYIYHLTVSRYGSAN